MKRGEKQPAIHIQSWLNLKTEAEAVATYQRALEQGLTPREILNQALTLYGRKYDIFPAPRPKSSDINMKSYDVLTRAEAVLAEIQTAMAQGFSRVSTHNEPEYEGAINVLSESAAQMIATAPHELPE